MYKKLNHLISFVLVLVLASTTYGNGILIGNFEDVNDGWARVDPNDPCVSISYSTTGVTLGSKSLKIADTSTGYQLVIAYDVIGNGMLDNFRKNLKVSADITRLASEWIGIGGEWCDLFLAVQAGSSGDPNEPNDPNEWDFWDELDEDARWQPGDGNDPITFIYDYSLTLNQIDFNNLEYLQFIFCTNWGGYDPGGTYYLDNVQMFSGGQAYDPEPANGARDVRPETILSWTPGVYANKHDVYFSTDFNSVNDANRTDTLGVLVSQNQTANTYDPPGFLKSGKTYYWRIDEVNAPPDYTIYKGDVWSFTTAYPGVGVVIGDWEKSMDGWVKAPQAPAELTTSFCTIGVTLGDYSLGVFVPSPTYWALMRDGVLNLTGMKLELDVTMIASEWSGQWTKVDKLAVNSDQGWIEFTPTAIDRVTGLPTSLDWGSWEGNAYKTYTWDLSSRDANWMGTINWMTMSLAMQNPGGGTGLFYIDNARLIDVRLASNPRPLDHSTGVQRAPTLSWKPGKYAIKHDVYFGTNFNDVNNANRINDPCGVLVSKNQDVNTYVPGALQLNTIYYWRIDEVNDPNIWKGAVWVFMTGNYLKVDDFERYSPNPGLTNVWKAGGKAAVSLSTAPVHEDLQAMTIDYNNTASPYYCEAYANTNGPNSLDLEFGTNWLAEGVRALSLWLRGYPDVRGSFSYTGTDPNNLYTVKISGSGADIWGSSDQFRYAYRKLTDVGSITARVDNMDNTDAWAKVGLMMRSTLDPGSRYVDIVVTPSSGVSFQYREETDSNCAETTITGVTAPHWVRLTRHWDISDIYYIYAEHANDVGGSCVGDWTQIGSNVDTTLSNGWPVEMYIGLCVCSHNANVICDANFSSVTVGDLDPDYSAITEDWESQDINIPYNAPEPMYVTLQDNDSNAAWYYPDTNNPNYADANVTQTSAWMEWRIDLNDFRVQGVDLSKVQRMYIGVGDRVPGGGPGTVHIDDIRLYRPEFVAGKLPKIPADLVYDGVINEADLGVVADNWLQVPTDPNIDLYGGGTIDFRDFAEFGKYWCQQQVWPTW